jgi:hypothetical protein
MNTKYTDFDHTPMQPVRELLGEQVFAKAWNKLLSTPVGETTAATLDQILEAFSWRYTIEPRDAKVLASVVTWFGTRCGVIFLESANKNSDANDRYLREWTSKNRMVPWVNQGQRPLESILYGAGSETRVTLRELEAVECLMSWLGSSPDASEFMADCEAEIHHGDKVASLVHHLSANCGLKDSQVQQVLGMVRGLAA